MPKPIAPQGNYCPLWRKDVSKVCHTCEWYERMVGTHPSTGEPMDKWGCAIRWMPILQIEARKGMDGVQKATESFRNEMVQMNQPKPVVILAPKHVREVGHDDSKR
jgi:hypothetical protein